MAVDRFSKWPTVEICHRTDTRTVVKFLTEYFINNGTPKTIRTDNATCFKSEEFKAFCDGEHIKRIRSTPNLHTGTGLVERTIRSIKDLIRTNLQDGLNFTDSVKLAVKTMRLTPNSRLKITPFELHMGRKPRTPITNIVNGEKCLLSNWKRLMTEYISAHPKELQVYTIKDSDGSLVDYIVMNDKRKFKSVSNEFTPYQFYERENKPNAMKQKFKTGKILTAASESEHTVLTTDGLQKKIRLHKKLISKPLIFQPIRKEDSKRGTNKRCERCGRYYQGEECTATHKDETQFPTMPTEEHVTTEQDEDRRMGLGTSKQNTPNDTLELHANPSEITTFGEGNGSETNERASEAVETPIRVSTQKTVRINRKNFRSPGASIIPSGVVDVSEGELSPTNLSRPAERDNGECMHTYERN